MDWTAEQIEALRRLWATDLSTAAIGREMGLTKSAVVGKAHRLNLPPRPSPIRTGANPAAAEPVPRRVGRRASVPKPLPIPLPVRIPAAVGPAERDLPAGAAQGRAVTSLPGRAALDAAPSLRGGCRWPLWGDRERPSHRYCGGVRRDDACPYCRDHAAIAFAQRGARELVA